MATRGRRAFLAGARGDHAPGDPRTALVRNGSTTYAWSLATDALAWGPTAREATGLADLPAEGRAFARLVEAEGGISRADAVRAASGPDRGDGVPYAARYALRLKGDRLVMVEDTGRWFADLRGRPALARGLLRVEPGAGGPDSLHGGLRARAALLAAIAPQVAEAEGSRHGLTLIVGCFEAEDPAGAMAWVGERVRPILRRRDRFIPYGEERFALALASCPAGEAESAVRRAAALLSQAERPSRLRLGAATAPAHGTQAPDLLRHAEEALAQPGRPAVYAARRRPRPGRIVGTSAADILDALNARRLACATRRAVDGRSREPAFATAIAGIAGEDGRLALPGDLAAAAARDGLATLVDARTLEIVADHLAGRPDERLVLPIAGSTLRDPDWLGTLAAHLGARPGVQSRLIVEIPEEALAEPEAAGRLNALKALGVGTMLGGFGGGIVSARMLRGLALDVLKIDARFVQALPRSTADRLVLRTLIDLAQHVGLASLADGVAEEAAARLLAEWGVDYLQGPFLGDPTRLRGRDQAPARRSRAV